MREVEVKGLKFWVEQQGGFKLERNLHPTVDGKLRDTNLYNKGYALEGKVNDKVIWDKMTKNGRKPHHSDTIAWARAPTELRQV